MYLALYRKYRPKSFDDVVSQPHITTTLRNQIMTGKAAHAYLFTGSRGTGKTTCAKILSMAFNCHNPVDGNPCMQCANCREIDSGDAVDIVEMDAASNRGVDDVRRLREEVSYTPVTCKYRVYIIDEVHMLTPEAFNALLKTLEEPPAHVKFILATTELHKVLPTIVSRCQRFEFRRIDVADSAARLVHIADLEGVSLDYDAAELISRLSDGGMRDALSILDRCISAEKHVTSELVRSCAGVADNRHLLRFSEMIAAGDISGCIRLLTELHNGSKDIARIIDELSGHFRDLMLCKAAPGEKSLLTAMPDDYEELERICSLFSLDDILRCLTLLQQCADGLSKTKQRKTVAEMCFVKMCLGYGAVTASDAPARVATAIRSTAEVKAAADAKNDEMRKLEEAIINSGNDKLTPKERRDMERFRSMAAAIAEESKPMPDASKPAPLSEAPTTVTEVEKSVHVTEAPKPVQEIASVAEQSKSATNATVEVSPNEALLPEFNSTAAAPVMDEIPIPEEPNEEFVPQREFDTAAMTHPVSTEDKYLPDRLQVENSSVTQDVLNEAAKNSIVQEKPVDNKASVEVSDETGEALAPLVEPIKSITPAQWDEIVAKMPYIYGEWMRQTTAKLNSGVLEIHTNNESFKAIVENRGYSDIEKVLREVIGKPVKALVVLDETEQTAEENNDAVKQLLEKARQLGIEVKIKQ